MKKIKQKIKNILKNMFNAKGFTLLELLVVVLIIGLLTSIAVPGYRKAVEKSKVADALTTMQAVAKSEHGWYLTNNSYTDDFANLDITLIDKDGVKAKDESFESANYTFNLYDDYIEAVRNNNEYSLFKFYEQGDVYCLPQEHYICQLNEWRDFMNQKRCNDIEGFWSNKTSRCYDTEQERCVDSDTGATWHTARGGFCGYNGENKVYVGEDEKCVGAGGAACAYSTFTGAGSECVDKSVYVTDPICQYSYFYEGSKCNAVSMTACNNSHFSKAECYGNNSGCRYSTFTAGSVCYANSNGDYAGCGYGDFLNSSVCVANATFGCNGSTFANGSICYGNADRGCSYYSTSYDSTSCCCGTYCGDKPKCSDRGIECDPKYMS